MIEPDLLTAGSHLDLATQAHPSAHALFWSPVAKGRLNDSTPNVGIQP